MASSFVPAATGSAHTPLGPTFIYMLGAERGDLSKPNNKMKPKKRTNDDKEKEVIAEFENDSKEILETRINCGLKFDEIKCKKCDFETFSEGLFGVHRRTVHQVKESNLNVI